MKNKHNTFAFAFSNIALLNPQGIIAREERNLIIIVVLIMLIIVVPALVLTYTFAWKYRAGSSNNKIIENHRGKNSEDNKSSRWVFLFWLGPAFIIFIIGLITWQSTHTLDPQKSLVSENPPITIQVVALNWKWLFMYPDQGIATVNFLEIPEKTPVHFELTADAPMNSFWIPQLGGQMYAMPGMSTQLNLMANAIGDFSGSAAEVNGSGFSGMKFKVQSRSQANFNDWVNSVKASPDTLTKQEYDILSKSSENNPVVLYSSVDENLYNEVMGKFMPASNQPVQDMDMIKSY